MFQIEQELYESGHKYIACIDEGAMLLEYLRDRRNMSTLLEDA